MKGFLIPALLVVSVLLASCSGGGNTTPVTAADRDQAMQAISGAQNTAYAGGAGWSYSAAGDTMTANGPNASVTMVFSPSYAAFGSNGSSLTITMVMTGYVDSVTGYSVSGTLTSVMTCGPTGLETITFNGTFTLQGGNVHTVTMNAQMNLTTSSYSGTVVVNGQTFVY